MRACGLRLPLCVHGPKGSEREVLEVLRIADDAHRLATGALRFPAPDPDVTTGALDIYLTDAPAEDASTRFNARDPLASYDRASGFVELPRSLTGCAREAAVHRSLLRAIILRVAPATSDGLSLATSSHLSELTVPCAQGRVDDAAAFQREPSRAIFDAGPSDRDPAYARGAAAFFGWADARFGSEPGGLVRAALAIVPTMTPPGGEHFVHRPDLFEVLRNSFKGRLSVGSSIDDVFLRFAGARATFGTHADASTLASTRAWGAAGSVFVDHAIDWPAAPRRFLSPKPVAPTGATYIAVRRQGAPPGSRLRIEAEWEEHARFRWMVIKLDPKGVPLASVLVPATPRATSAQATVAELDGTDVVLLVAMNAGDFARPFDPDDGVWEPHAFLVTVASE